MSEAIPDREEILAKVNLADLMARDSIEIFDRGRSLWCRLRPEDRSPSCILNRPEKTGDFWSFHDFGDSRLHGNAIDYEVKVRGKSLKDALADLRAVAGCPPPPAKIAPAPRFNSSAESASSSLSPFPAEDRTGTDEEVAQLSRSRNVSEETVRSLENAGILSFGHWNGRDAYFLYGQNTLAQARRLDRKDWFKNAKALYEPGSTKRGKWIEYGLGPEATAVILSEGLVSILEVAEIIRRTGLRNCAAVAFPDSAECLTSPLLDRLLQRRVLVIGDGGVPGRGFATRMETKLLEFGGAVSVLQCAEDCDTGDLLSLEDTDLREQVLRLLCEAGETVVVHSTDDRDLVAWSKAQGLYTDVMRANPFHGRSKEDYPFGNPFSVQKHGRDECLRLFRDVTMKEPEYLALLDGLKASSGTRGRILGCKCHPEPCHGHAIADYLNRHSN
jgi:hypothetical protein